MASGRTSCTVGALRTAEVYHNNSGGASSVTLYATSTIKDSCFDLNVNISDTSVTPESETTLLTACASNSVCGCFTFGGVNQFENLDDGTFAGISCFTMSNGIVTNYYPQQLYIRCTGTVCGDIYTCVCTGVTQPFEGYYQGAPLPWIGSLKASNTTDLIPVINHCTPSTLRLQCFTCFGGTVEPERAQEWAAIAGTVQASKCNCCAPDRDNCCGNVSCYAYRPCYGQVGVRNNLCGTDRCNLFQPITIDYWSTHRLAMWMAPSAACPNCIETCYICISCEDRPAACFTVSNNCMDNVLQGDSWNHCCGLFHNHICLQSISSSSYLSCICNQYGDTSGHRARMQRHVSLGCNTGFFSNSLCGNGIWRGRTGGNGHCLDQFLCACYAGCCSRAKFCWFPDGTSPLKWITYNCIDQKNYFLWYHDNTPDWNGIYSQDQTQVDTLVTHSCGCACSCSCYPSGDEYPTTFATKVADVPACWTSTNACDTFFTNAHQIGPTCFVTHLNRFNSDCHCFRPERYFSSDLKTWECSICEGSASFAVDTSNFYSGSSTTISKVASGYANLCDSGQIENCACGVQLERTGVVTSNGDRIYVKNSSTTPVSISVWGYEE